VSAEMATQIVLNKKRRARAPAGSGSQFDNPMYAESDVTSDDEGTEQMGMEEAIQEIEE
jgi:hypothetical protein